MSFIQVVDLSHWQGKAVDFQKAKAAGIRGVISKCTEYGFGIDPDYVAVQEMVRKAGLLSGAYFFFHAGNVAAQVEYFLTHAYATDNTLVAIDHERAPNQTRPSISDLITACELIEKKLGRKAVIYSGNDIREELGRTANAYLGQHRFWDASYTSQPLMTPTWRGKPWLWQCSGDGAGPYRSYGTVPGIGTKLDVNHYFGTDEQLAAEWAAGPAKPAAVA